MKPIRIAALAALIIPATAQTAGGGAQVFPAQQVQAQMARLAKLSKEPGSAGEPLGIYKTHALQLSVRTTSGGAEVHAHFDDVIFVTMGKATLVTGGTVDDPRTDAEGETKGSAIRDGRSQSISVGDIIHIPAGTPHQMLIPDGVTFGATVVKVRE